MSIPAFRRAAFRRLARGVLLFLCFFLPASHAATMDNGAALNKATNLHLLSERIARTYTLIGRDILADKSKRQLAAAVSQFDKQLKELQAYAPTPDIKENDELLDQLWGTYKAAVRSAPEKSKVKELSEFNEKVVWIAQKGSQPVEARAQSRNSRLINLAGQQRTLSQRMAKLYLFRGWGLGSKVLDDDLQTARTAFMEGLKQLNGAPQNTEMIRNELKLAEQERYFFDQAVNDKNNDLSPKMRETNIATTSDRLLEVMDQVT